MQHQIPVDQLGPQGAPMAEAVDKCVHCGFCLPVCPTYEVMGEEMDSPRGRIFLMKEVLEGRVDLQEATTFVDRCLGCVACETACPSGVEYGQLITAYRGRAETVRRRTWGDRLLRWMMLSTLPYPARFRWAATMGRWARPLAGMFPRRMRAMLSLLPAKLPPRAVLPELTPAEGPRRARVALLATCAQQVLAPEINAATLRVLARNGVEVIVPSAQGCCGALAAHTGAQSLAQRMAIQNLTAFPDDVDAVLTNAAGCGSGLHEYPLWLRGSEHEERAKAMAAKVRDVSQFLAELGLEPLALPRSAKVAYHDACHLAHAQSVRQQPRQLLRQVDGLELLEIPDELCCGSAGTYNVEQPETAAALGARKAAVIRDLKADVVATGNIGCMTQLQMHLGADGPIVMHTMQVLDQAYRGEPLL
ncbi:MAG: glycolate oxidase subunit GlcF [Planctomycetales bacterium]|nr:glycolate oxidase subunit GlcF [Planctomycetales bacterium]